MGLAHVFNCSLSLVLGRGLMVDVSQRRPGPEGWFACVIRKYFVISLGMPYFWAGASSVVHSDSALGAGVCLSVDLPLGQRSKCVLKVVFGHTFFRAEIWLSDLENLISWGLFSDVISHGKE